MIKILLALSAANFVLLLLIFKKQTNMAQTMEEKFNDVLNTIDTETTRVADDLLDLKDQVKKYGLPAEVETNILERLQHHADVLRGMGAADSPATDGSPATDITSPETDIV